MIELNTKRFRRVLCNATFIILMISMTYASLLSRDPSHYETGSFIDPGVEDQLRMVRKAVRPPPPEVKSDEHDDSSDIGIVALLILLVLTYRFRNWMRYNIVRLGARHDLSHITRSGFNRLSNPRLPKDLAKDHTHPESAFRRNAACFLAQELATSCGLQVYSSSMSCADQRNGRLGDRPYYWAKDLTAAPRLDDCPNNYLWTMIDVDYHVTDLPTALANRSQPTFLYTIIPTHAAKCVGETTYCFTDKGKFRAHVSGGSVYEHELWDYNYDNIWCSSKYGWKLTTFLVEKRHLSDFQAIVLLTPVMTFWGPAAWLARWFLESHELRRFNPVSGNHVIFHVKENIGSSVTVSRVNGFSSARVPAQVFESCFIAQDCGTTNANLATMRSWLPKDFDEQDARQTAAYLLDYYRAKRTGFIPTVSPTALSDRSYSANVDNAGDAPEPPAVVPFMSPLDNRAYNPTRCPHNDKWAVDSRVLGLIRENDKLNEPSPRIKGFMSEFVQFVAEEVGVLYPVEVEDVERQQSTRAQKIGLLQAYQLGVDVFHKVKSFMKREAYGEIKDPRVITTFDASVKLDYAAFILPLSASLKQFSWYGFQVPSLIAQGVVETVRGCDHVIETDFARFDGRVTTILREKLDLPLLLAIFPNHRSAVDEAYHRQYNNRVRMGGLKYDAGATQHSGSMDTSAINTLRGRALIYVGLRLAGLDPLDAWRYRSLHGGDDGLIGIRRGLSVEGVVNGLSVASRAFGQKIEASVVPHGVPFTFLARYFCAWNGDANSMCDVKRQVMKLHTTVNVPLSPQAKLREKAHSFALTDSNTPIIGPWATWCLEKLGPVRPGTTLNKDVTSWWAQFDLVDQFPNEKREWMDEVVEATYSEFDFKLLSAAMEANTSPLALPLCVSPDEVLATKTPVVIDGDVTRPIQSQPLGPANVPAPTMQQPRSSTSRPTKGRPGEKDLRQHVPAQLPQRSRNPNAKDRTSGRAPVPQRVGRDEARGERPAGRGDPALGRPRKDTSRASNANGGRNKPRTVEQTTAGDKTPRGPPDRPVGIASPDEPSSSTGGKREEPSSRPSPAVEPASPPVSTPPQGPTKGAASQPKAGSKANKAPGKPQGNNVGPTPTADGRRDGASGGELARRLAPGPDKPATKSPAGHAKKPPRQSSSSASEQVVKK